MNKNQDIEETEAAIKIEHFEGLLKKVKNKTATEKESEEVFSKMTNLQKIIFTGLNDQIFNREDVERLAKFFITEKGCLWALEIKFNYKLKGIEK